MDKEFKELCKNYRKEIIEIGSKNGIGHFGGTLSVVEIITYLYHHFMKENEDTFILSKGHAALMQYLALKGLGKVKEDVSDYGMVNSKLEAHPSINLDGIKFPSGSLGQGLSGAVGYSIAKKEKGEEGYTICLVGDGELNEGQIWEALISLSQLNIEKFILIIDFNGFQLDGPTFNVLNIKNMVRILEVFKWDVIEANGHDFNDLNNTFRTIRESNIKRQAVLINTVKGNGVDFMENNNDYHGSFCYSIEEEAKRALSYIEGD